MSISHDEVENKPTLGMLFLFCSAIHIFHILMENPSNSLSLPAPSLLWERWRKFDIKVTLFMKLMAAFRDGLA